MRHCASFVCALALLAHGAMAQAELRTITLLYTTDTHGHVFATSQSIGLDRVASLKKSMPGALLLDAGDFLHGTPAATLNQGKDIVALMQEAGYFAATLGNHEFSYDLAVLEARKAQAASGDRPMHLLSATVERLDGTLLVAPSVSVRVDDVKVCIFGLTTQETASSASPTVAANFTFADVEKAAISQTARLREEGCNVVVALAHVGSSTSQAFTSTALAERVAGLDAIIDGHSHNELDYKAENGTLVVSSGAYGKKVGLLRFDTQRKRVVSRENTLLDAEALAALPPTPALAARLERLQAEIQARLSTQVAYTEHELIGDKRRIRTEETNLGNLCADALRLSLAGDVAIINAGVLRETIPRGWVTRQNILATLPFSDYVASTVVSGAELREILEHALSRLPNADGAFPQISGLLVQLAGENNPGNRILAVSLPDKTPLDPKKAYRLVTNGYLAEGGDGYPHLAGRLRIRTAPSLENIVTDYLQKTRGENYAPSTPQRLLFSRTP